MFPLVPVIRHVRREGLHQAGEVQYLLPHLLRDETHVLEAPVPMQNMLQQISSDVGGSS